MTTPNDLVRAFLAAGELLAKLESSAPNGSVSIEYEKRTGVFRFRWDGLVREKRYGWQMCVDSISFSLDGPGLIDAIAHRFRRELDATHSSSPSRHEAVTDIKGE